MQLKLDLSLIFVSFFLVGISIGNVQSTEFHQEWLEKGREAENNGEYEKALNIWFEARIQLDTPSVAIGTEFVRLATEKQLSHYYKPAHLMYMWGLEADEIGPNKEALRKELQRLRPIVKLMLYQEWGDLLDHEDPELYTEIRKFWERKNYLPDSRYNPRLIEHWQRIAYVKRHFGDPLDSTSTADDRVAHYIRFGKPDREIIQDLQIETKEIIEFIIDQMSRGGEEPASEYQEIAIDIANSVKQYEENTELNVWVYDAESVGSEQNLILIFRKTGENYYQRVNSVGSLIPETAFSEKIYFKSNRFTYNRFFLYGISGMTMQYFYYSKLRDLDDHFATQQQFIKDASFNNTSEYPDDASSGWRLKNRLNNEQSRNYKSAATDRSVSLEELPEIPLDIYQYRLVSESDTPVYATFVESHPTRAYVRDYAAHRGKAGYVPNTSSIEISLEENYQLQHIFKQVDESAQPIGQLIQESALKIYGEELSGTSAFIIPIVADSVKQVMYSILRNEELESSNSDSPNPPGLIGLGKKEFEQPEHFEIDPEKLMASDLIVGYGRDVSSSTENLFPFTVSNDKKIPEYENVVVHFEVYHLETDRDGFSRFEVDYSFEPVGGFFGRFRGSEADQNFTLSFKPQSSRFSESLEIKTESLEAGEYNFNFTITDLTDGEKINRSVRFEVTENQLSNKTTAIE